MRKISVIAGVLALLVGASVVWAGSPCEGAPGIKCSGSLIKHPATPGAAYVLAGQGWTIQKYSGSPTGTCVVKCIETGKGGPLDCSDDPAIFCAAGDLKCVRCKIGEVIGSLVCNDGDVWFCKTGL